MSHSYGQEVFTLTPGQLINLNTVFNGDFDAGGDYKGPMVVAGIANTTDRALTTSTVGVLFKSIGDNTSPCVYTYNFQNDNSDTVSFKVHFFYD